MMKKSNYIVVGLSVIFLLITFLLETKFITSFDTVIYNLVTTNMNEFWTGFNRVFTFLSSTELIVSVCVILFGVFFYLKKRNISYFVVGSLALSTTVNNIVKLIVRRERPTVLELVEEGTFSYPSGHTMCATSLYLLLVYLVIKSDISKRLKIVLSVILSIIPFLVAISRIYLGAHFASDVIAAIILAIILLIVEVNLLVKKKWL